MPQKRNPDVFELVRGAQATAAGALQEILGLTAKLTSGYHRDLQRLKAPLFRSIDLAGDVLAIMAHALPNVRFRPENIELGPELYAAEQANELVVKEGLPFREAYRRIAALLKAQRRVDDGSRVRVPRSSRALLACRRRRLRPAGPLALPERRAARSNASARRQPSEPEHDATTSGEDER